MALYRGGIEESRHHGLQAFAAGSLLSFRRAALGWADGLFLRRARARRFRRPDFPADAVFFSLESSGVSRTSGGGMNPKDFPGKCPGDLLADFLGVFPGALRFRESRALADADFLPLGFRVTGPA